MFHVREVLQIQQSLNNDFLHQQLCKQANQQTPPKVAQTKSCFCKAWRGLNDQIKFHRGHHQAWCLQIDQQQSGLKGNIFQGK